MNAAEHAVALTGMRIEVAELDNAGNLIASTIAGSFGVREDGEIAAAFVPAMSLNVRTATLEIRTAAGAVLERIAV